MVFVRGADQAEFVSRLRGVSGERVLLVPIDVGKRSAMSLVANQFGEVIVDPFAFVLDRPGVDGLLDRVTDAEETADAVVVRFGIEAAGHYHRTLMTALQAAPVEVVELHPGAVHKARAEMGQRRLKSDLRDLAAMVELMARGAGRVSRWGDGPLAIQAVWSMHRRALRAWRHRRRLWRRSDRRTRRDPIRLLVDSDGYDTAGIGDGAVDAAVGDTLEGLMDGCTFELGLIDNDESGDWSDGDDLVVKSDEFGSPPDGIWHADTDPVVLDLNGSLKEGPDGLKFDGELARAHIRYRANDKDGCWAPGEDLFIDSNDNSLLDNYQSWGG